MHLRLNSHRPGLLKLLQFVLVSLVFAGPARALDPEKSIAQYGHSAWTLQDGSIPGAPIAMVQTADGYLWLGTRAGVVRFDGVRFVPLTPPGAEQLVSPRVLSLGTSHDGSLWIGLRGDLERWYAGHLTHYPDAPGSINSINEDGAGKVWFTRISSDSDGALCEVVGERSVCHGSADGVPFKDLQQVISGPHDSLWAISQTTLMRRQGNATHTWLPPGVSGSDEGRAALDVLQSVLPTADGAVWVGAAQPSRGLGLLRLMKDEMQPFVVPHLDGRRLAVSRLLLDRQKSLWIGTQEDGVYRLSGDQVSHYRSADGLSSDTVQNLFEDREGTVWVLTTRGIDAFRDLRVVSITKHEGLSADLANAVLATRDGAVLIDTWHSLDILHGAEATSRTPRNGLPGEEVMALLQDRSGTVWVGIDSDLYVFENDKFVLIGRSVGLVEGMAEDASGDIFVTTTSPPTLVRVHNRKVMEQISQEVLGFTYGGIVADPHDGIWLSLKNGDLGRYRSGQLERIEMHRPPKTVIWGLVAYSDGTIVGATSGGLIGLHDGKTFTLTVANGLPCNEIHTLLIDRRGALWLYAACGVVSIQSDELQAGWQDPAKRLTARVFDALDGAQPARGNFFPRASLGPDGRIWFANASIVQMIDPDRLDRNPLPPPVHIEQIIADRTSYSAQSGLRLSSRTRDLEVDYTALSLVVPRKTHFRYRLVGHDADWQEAGARRQAFYTDLAPGDYRFAVTASNNDGVWNATGASVDFSIAPVFYQTRWFLALAVGMTLSALYLLYLMRVRQIENRLRMRLEERLSERERIARDLHDTFLQSVQGLILKFQAVLSHMPEGGLRHMLEEALDRADLVIIEGRDRVGDLRASTPASDELPQALRRYGVELSEPGGTEFRITIEGLARTLHPVVHEEAYRIGAEALANAFRHSAARQVDIAITYSRHGLSLRIVDDGRGFDVASLATNAPAGHFGLLGMRERARRIQARLEISSRPGTGSRVELQVPASSAYGSDRRALHL